MNARLVRRVGAAVATVVMAVTVSASSAFALGSFETKAVPPVAQYADATGGY